MTVSDWLGGSNTLGIDIWEKKYQKGNETFDEWINRISDGDEEIKELILQKKFLPGGRIMSNIGIDDEKSSLMNCYSRGFIEDDYNDIMQAAMDIGKTFKAQGGQGLSLSKLRPKGTPIGKHYTSDGIIPFMKIYNEVTAQTSQGGSRKGALMISLDAWHKEALDFITIKSNEHSIEKANISLEIDDEFMKAVDTYYKTGEEITVHRKQNYSGHEIEWDVTPIKVFKAMVHNNYDWGDPGCLFVNRLRNYNMMEFVDEYNIDTTNPCLHPDTLIQTTEGLVKIKDMNKPMMVYCMDENENLVIRKSSPSFKTRENAELLSLTINKLYTIKLTPDHLIYIRGKGWIKAKEVVTGDVPVMLIRGRRGAQYVGVRLSGVDRNHQVMEHRLVYESYYGKIPEGYDIHHIDNNSFNNCITNLRLISHSEHSTLTRYSCANNHQIRNASTGRFITSESSKHSNKPIINPPEEMRTKLYCTPRITAISRCENSDVYDLVVDDVHNFIANGIVVHNCGEQPLKKNSACCLSSINMSEFVTDPYTSSAKFDLDGFLFAVKCGIRYLDHVIDVNINRHPLEEQRKNSFDFRNIGLGCFGYGTALMKLGIKYGSKTALELTHILFSEMFRMAVKTSSELAKDFGSFPRYADNADKIWESKIIQKHFNKEEIEILKQNGLRNCTVLSIAPTGSLATLLNESGGIEPEYAISYTRRTVGLTNNEDHYYKVYCKAAREYMEKYNTEKLPDYFIGSADINPFDRVLTQAVMQEHVDTGISSTVNLPESASEELMEKIYLEAWRAGLKGITIFRDNCKKIGILTTKDSIDNSTKNELQRGEVIKCSDKLIGLKRKILTGCGSLHINAYFDPETKQLQEVYFAKGSTGGCANTLTGLSRTISLLCRAGVDIYTIKDQLDSTGVCPSYAVRTATKHDTSKGSCCPMAIGNALVEMYESFNQEPLSKPIYKLDMKNVASSEKCPECGSELKHSGGCDFCPSCGYSHCS